MRGWSKTHWEQTKWHFLNSRSITGNLRHFLGAQKLLLAVHNGRDGAADSIVCAKPWAARFIIVASDLVGKVWGPNT